MKVQNYHQTNMKKIYRLKKINRLQTKIIETISTTHKVQINGYETKIDRLSKLPDDLIHYILSFMDIRSAVRTCLLSKEWRHHWTNLQSINFEDKAFGRWIDYGKFVRRVLRRRKPCNLRRLRYRCSGRKDKSLVNRIFNYAKKHNLEELDTDLCIFPPRLYECQTLKTLRFGPNCNISQAPNVFAFTSLRTLQLFRIWLSNHDLFSSCVNLKTLILINCRMFALRSFSIPAPELVKLVISDLEDCSPGNKNLLISTPKLKFFDFKGRYPMVFKMDKCLSIEKVNVHIFLPLADSLEKNHMKEPYTSALIAMAKGFYNAKSVTISFNLLKGKFILQRNCSNPVTATKIVEISKDIAGEWSIDLTKVRQHLDSSGFHMKWQP